MSDGLWAVDPPAPSHPPPEAWWRAWWDAHGCDVAAPGAPDTRAEPSPPPGAWWTPAPPQRGALESRRRSSGRHA